MENRTTKEKADAKFETIMDEAMRMFRRFEPRLQIPVKNLEEFAYKLSEAVNIDENRVEPYVFLSYVFFEMGQNDLAFEYLNKADSIDPTFPDIENLNQAIIKHLTK
jgi:hypothetical protein